MESRAQLHKPTLSCLYEALREADGTLRFITKRLGLARFAGGYSRLSFGLRIGCFFGSLESEETHLNGEE